MLTVLYSAFAALCGVVEAVLYSRRGAEAFLRNEHVEMVMQRAAALLLVPVAILAYQVGGWWFVGAELVASVLIFSLAHDEAYNFTRLWIYWSHSDPSIPGSQLPDRRAFALAWMEYRYGYQSPTTTARNDFNGTQRTLLALTGLAVELAALLVLVV